MRLDRRLDVMFEIPVLRIGNVSDAEQSFDLHPAFIGDRNVAVLLVDHEVAGKLRRLPWRNVELLTLFQLGDNPIDLVILVGRLLARARK